MAALARFAAFAMVLQLSLARCVRSQECNEATFKAILANITGATLNYVARVPQNGSFGDAETNQGYPVNATDLPELCAASINVRSSASSSFNFGLFLPNKTWNGRLMTTGNGGFAGGINYPDMGILSQYGFATISTDTGHNSNPVDGSWGFNQPERLFDWGYRAIHGSVATAKQVVTEYYRRPIKYSYYAGCSTGGRQGLKEIQDHPDSFDGVSIGAPAWQYPNLPASTLKQGLYNLPFDGPNRIPPNLFPVIVAEMVKQCDPQDGLRDGIISDPAGCHFNFNKLLCTASSPPNSCLTAPQLNTAFQYYSNFVDVNQTFVFPGMSLGVDPFLTLSGPVPLGPDYFRYWVKNDSNWDPTTFNYGDIEQAMRVQPGQASADNFDLSPFAQRGGKMIMYHGLADNLVATGTSGVFWNRVYSTLAPRGVDLESFYRLFYIPGMQHCGGTAQGAPWYIAGAGQTVQGSTHGVPGFDDADHDVILALMRWVEKDIAPAALVATKYRGDDSAMGVERQRPLCVYPKQAKYNGGDPDSPSSWSCQEIY